MKLVAWGVKKMALSELSLDACRALSASTGLPLDFIVKELRVFDALVELTVFNAEERELVFKGGTALNKIHFSGVQRFSEDLDFDLVKARSVEEAIEFMKETALVLGKAGFSTGRIRRIGRRAPSLQLECGFQTPFGRKDFVRIDAAVKPSIALRDVVENAVAKSAFVERVVAGVKAYSLDGLVARKLAALAERCEGRDVYDVCNGIELVSKDFPNAVRRLLESEGKKESAEDLLKKAAEKLRKADYVELRNLTNPFIPSQLRPKDSGAWRAMALTLAEKLEAMAGA
jgi:hypothetical protein